MEVKKNGIILESFVRNLMKFNFDEDIKSIFIL